MITKEYLEEHYIKLCKSCKTIALELGLKSGTSIKRALKKFDITARSRHFNQDAIHRSRQARWKGCGKLSGRYFNVLKNRAKRLNREFNLTVEYLWELFIKQNMKCALSDEPIDFPNTTTNLTFSQQTASLDRIDSTKGYIIGNVQWVHKDINSMKMDLQQEEFIKRCQQVSKKFEGVCL